MGILPMQTKRETRQMGGTDKRSLPVLAAMERKRWVAEPALNLLARVAIRNTHTHDGMNLVR